MTHLARLSGMSAPGGLPIALLSLRATNAALHRFRALNAG
jgi:hypothetical protein